ncbi:hypothetical protein AYI68_g1112 [Smittium mucronatum]|uniref:Uncharacterized protein n=1 Tax=Smittium mucronatum TaxID=133383 RepID=A0A1R0H6A9_9FUNG|nr:hypothetical protein AYI68_g1112 [Smittium mucronatum]
MANKNNTRYPLYRHINQNTLGILFIKKKKNLSTVTSKPVFRSLNDRRVMEISYIHKKIFEQTWKKGLKVECRKLNDLAIP